MPRRTLHATALTLFAAFTLALSLAAMPHWHERLHCDSDLPQHQCVVTLISSGKVEHLTALALPGIPSLASSFAAIAALAPRWVAALFLRAAIFEHAPPKGS